MTVALRHAAYAAAKAVVGTEPTATLLWEHEAVLLLRARPGRPCSPRQRFSGGGAGPRTRSRQCSEISGNGENAQTVLSLEPLDVAQVHLGPGVETVQHNRRHRGQGAECFERESHRVDRPQARISHQGHDVDFEGDARGGAVPVHGKGDRCPPAVSTGPDLDRSKSPSPSSLQASGSGGHVLDHERRTSDATQS